MSTPWRRLCSFCKAGHNRYVGLAVSVILVGSSRWNLLLVACQPNNISFSLSSRSWSDSDDVRGGVRLRRGQWMSRNIPGRGSCGQQWIVTSGKSSDWFHQGLHLSHRATTHGDSGLNGRDGTRYHGVVNSMSDKTDQKRTTTSTDPRFVYFRIQRSSLGFRRSCWQVAQLMKTKASVLEVN